MSSYDYSFHVDRDNGTFDTYVNYTIDGYTDPETGEYFGDTSWNYSIVGEGISDGGGGYGAESESIYLSFGLGAGADIQQFDFQFDAQNIFSAVSISFGVNMLLAALATGDLRIGGSENGDLIVSGSDDDTLLGNDGDDHIDAGAGDDLLKGGLGNDILNGWLGADTMKGGGGGDIYNVDDAGDVIIEFPAGGGDHVITSVDYVLGDNLENMSLVAGGLTAGGNALDNRIDGSGGADSIDGADGNDSIYGNGGGGVLAGGEGNDFLLAGFGGAVDSMLSGGDGEDLLFGALTGVSWLYGGAGNDHFVGNAGSLIWVSYADASSRVRVDLAAPAANLGEAAGDTYSDIAHVLGSNFGDALFGTGTGELLSGALGNDKLRGSAGDDTLEGGLGADVIDGGDGTDAADYRRAAAGVRAELLAFANNSGEAAGDSYAAIENLLGSRFDDTLFGDQLANRLEGANGDDNLLGGDGDDTLVGGGGFDTLDGGGDIDTLSYQGANAALRVDLVNSSRNLGEAEGDVLASFENLIGGGHDDTLAGNGLANLLKGANGDDSLVGRGGADTLDGGNFQDTLVGGAGADLFRGGVGIDTADYARSNAAVAIDLANRTASGGHATGDDLRGIENLIGSDFNDTLTGLSEFFVGERLSGGLGDDMLDGLAGTDTLQGDAGADTLDGGDHDNWDYDTLSYGGDVEGVSIDFAIGIGSGGEAEGDVFTGFELVHGGAGDDTLTGDTDDFNIYDYLYGGAGDDLLEGQDDAGTIYTNIDELRGEEGDDTLIGSAEDGHSDLYGGAGADRFVIARESAFLVLEGSYDDIEDFESGADQIALTRDGGLGPAIGPVGALDPDAFRVGISAADAEDRIIYDAATGRLYFDQDGIGGIAQVQLAYLADRPTLDADDFVVI